MPTDIEMRRIKLAEASAKKEAVKPVVVEEPIVDIVEPVKEEKPVVVEKKTAPKKTTTKKKISSYTNTSREE